MADSILDAWATRQYFESMDFAGRSPVLRLAPAAGTQPPRRYIAEFHCDGLVHAPSGIEVVNRHIVGINFPAHYLRTPTRPGEVVTWIAPATEWHPNVNAPFACPGPIPPGMSLLNLLHQIFQMITWQRFTPREDDALNPAACRWARQNMERFPVDPRRSMAAPASVSADVTTSGAGSQ